MLPRECEAFGTVAARGEGLQVANGEPTARRITGRELPPPELDSDEAVVGYVLKHRGSLGYVSGSAKLERAKVVQVL